MRRLAPSSLYGEALTETSSSSCTNGRRNGVRLASSCMCLHAQRLAAIGRAAWLAGTLRCSRVNLPLRGNRADRKIVEVALGVGFENQAPLHNGIWKFGGHDTPPISAFFGSRDRRDVRCTSIGRRVLLALRLCERNAVVARAADCGIDSGQAAGRVCRAHAVGDPTICGQDRKIFQSGGTEA